MERTGAVRRFFGLPGARGVAGALAELALWWVAGTLSWLATASTVTLPEAATAAAAALVGAVLARAARLAMGFTAAVRGAWFRWATMVPAAAVADTLRLARWLPGPQTQDLGEKPMPAGDSPAATGWRAGAMVALSATPGSVVLDSDPRQHRVQVHTLVEGWPRLDDQVAAEPRREG